MNIISFKMKVQIWYLLDELLNVGTPMNEMKQKQLSRHQWGFFFHNFNRYNTSAAKKNNSSSERKKKDL